MVRGTYTHRLISIALRLRITGMTKATEYYARSLMQKLTLFKCLRFAYTLALLDRACFFATELEDVY